MKFLIFFILSIICCSAQYVGSENLDLRKTLWIVEEVMKRGDDFDDLVEFLKDSSISTSINGNRFPVAEESEVISTIKRLIDHIKENKLREGYIIEKQELETFTQNRIDRETKKEYEIHYFIFAIKIRSNSTKDIILFEFNNQEGGVWKLQVVTYCNNPQNDMQNEPCDKK